MNSRSKVMKSTKIPLQGIRSGVQVPIRFQLHRDLVRSMKRGHSWIYAGALRALPQTQRGVSAILLDNRGCREVMKAVMGIDFDVLVLDVVMPDGGGFEVLDQLKSYSLDFYTIVLSMYPEEQYALRALKAGASGYLTKDSIPEELIVAIRKVAQ